MKTNVGARNRQVQGLKHPFTRGMNESNTNDRRSNGDNEPRWSHRAKYIKHKPVWVDKIPPELHGLGEVFFPIPSGEKGYNYPHHLDEYRHGYDSEILNAHFEQSWGYGIACANDLAVVDIDKKEFAKEITRDLPDTLYQISGSREGYHLFYHVPELDSRIILHHPVEEHDCDNEDHPCAIGEDGDCVKEYQWDHLGEVKCDQHGYVVGPGSIHPSGNKYELRNSESITTLSKQELKDVISQFIKPDHSPSDQSYKSYESEYKDKSSTNEFYSLSADDVLPGLSEGKRIAHPVHGSSTGSNFIKNEGGETFTCWRCQYGGGDGCGLGGVHYLAAEQTGHDCDFVRSYWRNDSTLHYQAWANAVESGMIEPHVLPYRVAKGYLIVEADLGESDEISPQKYQSVREELLWEYCKCADQSYQEL